MEDNQFRGLYCWGISIWAILAALLFELSNTRYVLGSLFSLRYVPDTFFVMSMVCLVAGVHVWRKGG